MKTWMGLIVVACAVAGVSEPTAGIVVSRAGELRRIRGAAGSFVSGAVALTGVRAAAAAAITVVKLEDAVKVDGADPLEAPPGDAVFGFSRDGRSAFAWFAGDGSLARLDPTGIHRLPPTFSSVAALAQPDAGALDVYVRRDDGLHEMRVRLSDGAIERDVALGFDSNTVIALPNGTLVYAREATLVIRDADGAERTLDLDAPIESLALMGDERVHARCGELDIAVVIRPDRFDRFYIPAAPEVAQ